MKVGGCDIILGMDWIDMVAPAIFHIRPHSLSFMTDDIIITLYGMPEDSIVMLLILKNLRECYNVALLK